MRTGCFINLKMYLILTIACSAQLKVCRNAKGESPVLDLNKRLNDCGWSKPKA